MDIKKLVSKYKDEMIKDIIELVNINTVLADAKITKENPFGEGVTKGFDIMQSKAKELGWETTNVKNMAMDITIGKKSNDYVGLVCHMDVVPAVASNWNNKDPFNGYEDGKFIYGRGTQDDKGPLISLFYAMKIINEMNLNLKRNIRLIIGGNEETYHKGITEYFKHNEFPTVSFTADSEFPLTYVEKGSSHGIMVVNKPSNIISFSGGDAVNAVASWAEVKVIPIVNLEKEFNAFLDAKSLKGTYILKDGIATMRIEGKAAHGSIPHKGISAINKFADFLKNKYDSDLVAFLSKRFSDKFFGEGFDLKLPKEKADEVGQVSTNIGIIKTVENAIELHQDLRYPSTYTPNQIITSIKKTYNDSFKKVDFKLDKLSKPLFIPLDSPLASTLLKTYQEVTGDTKTQPIISGGGTYAKEIPNCLAFGLMFPYSENNMHAPNERLNIEELLIGTEIFIKAIIKLANLKY